MIYEKYLNNKKVIIELENKEKIICIFRKENFLHLTGVKLNIEIFSKNFYEKYKKGHIKTNQIIFDDYSKMKLDVFKNLELKITQKVILYKDNKIGFKTSHQVGKGSAILCIKNESPQSLLKKNTRIEGTNIKGKIISINKI